MHAFAQAVAGRGREALVQINLPPEVADLARVVKTGALELARTKGHVEGVGMACQWLLPVIGLLLTVCLYLWFQTIKLSRQNHPPRQP